MNAQLRNPSATTNYVGFMSGSEFGSEPKGRSLSTQSERVTHLHIETHHKTLWMLFGYARVKKDGDKRIL